METKIEAFWRDATAGDVARVMAGEKVEARFRDLESAKWAQNGCNLAGWAASQWASDSGLPWEYCQVYDPQQWWLDKPDPGEGWKLLEKFPDEPKLATDEAWDCHLREWRQTFTNDGDQAKAVWYRRRIESNPPEKLDSCVAYETKIDEVIQLPNGKRFKVTHAGFEVF